MPELPEVETVRRGLEPHMAGAKLSEVRLHRPNLRYPFPDRFAERLEGAEVLRLERRAKYLLFYLDTQDIWVTHLGMTGRFQATRLEMNDTPEDLARYYHAIAPDEKHLHFQCLATLPDGEISRIDYYDPRRFGFMLLLKPDELYESKWFKGLGVEPLSDDLNAGVLLKMARGRNVNLKALLMAQGGLRVWAISMSVKPCGGRGCLRTIRPQTSNRKPPRHSWKASRRCWKRRWLPAVRRSVTSRRLRVNWATSSTVSAFMTARVSPARAKMAAL